MRATLGTTGELALGEMPGYEAHFLIPRLKAEKLKVIAEGASFISYLPVDRSTGHALLIENEEENKLLVDAMIAVGVPVRSCEC